MARETFPVRTGAGRLRAPQGSDVIGCERYRGSPQAVVYIGDLRTRLGHGQHALRPRMIRNTTSSRLR